MSEYVSFVNDQKIHINLKNETMVDIDGKSYTYEILQKSDYTYVLRFKNKLYTITKVNGENNPFGILIEGNYLQVSVYSKVEDLALQMANSQQKSSGTKIIKSPMPGLVLKIKKNAGDSVSAGESIMILEAMKMENEIKSPLDGIIKELFVAEKQTVDRNEKLFVLE